MELKLEFEELYISGTGDIELQSKTVVPTKVEQVIIADEDYTALSKVIVEAIPNEYQDITVVTATADKVLQGYVFVGANGNTLQGEVPIIESAEVLLSSNKAEYNIPNGYHDGNGRVRVDFEELTATPTKETQEITASENKVLSKVTVLPIPDDYVNKNEVSKPTLNAPKIEFNANGGYMYILDGANGNFSEGYQLYHNGEESVILTSTNIKMQDYGISETDEVGIVAKNALFNNSPMATARWSDLELGTIGLTYFGNQWTGIGTATETNIVVAGLVNSAVIKIVKAEILMNNTQKMTIHLPNSISLVDYNFCWRAGNKTIVFGTDIKEIGTGFLTEVSGVSIVDLRKALTLPNLLAPIQKVKGSFKIIVRDEMYEEAIIATNWSATAHYFVKASVWEAQQGGAV